MIQIVTSNWKYKAGSLVLASLLWLGVVEESELATSVLAPIQYKNLPRDLEMSSDASDKVHLEVRGPASKLNAAMLADARVLLDLSAVDQPGDRTFPIDPLSLGLPLGVSLDRTVPAQVRLHFERRQTKEIRVTIRLRGAGAQGLEILEQTATPATLRITGPETRVTRIDTVDTDPIDVDGLKAAVVDYQVHAYLPDPQVRFVGDGRVTVRLRVKRN
ncbi:MAG: hypothetical protein FJW31_00825 [Acidobacteria bacterium]|nr:hypothetical protein [Acidobacteriota bacterium]